MQKSDFVQQELDEIKSVIENGVVTTHGWIARSCAIIPDGHSDREKDFEWLTEDKYPELLFLLAKKGAFSNIEALLLFFIRKFDPFCKMNDELRLKVAPVWYLPYLNSQVLFEMIQAQDADFFATCENYLLMASLILNQTKLARYIIEISKRPKDLVNSYALYVWNGHYRHEGSALEVAIQHSPSCVDFLLEKGADPNGYSGNILSLVQRVFFHEGSKVITNQIIETLLMYGANPITIYRKPVQDDVQRVILGDCFSNSLNKALNGDIEILQKFCTFGGGFTVQRNSVVVHMTWRLERTLFSEEGGISSLKILQSEISLRFIRNEKPCWIFTVKDLNILLNSAVECAKKDTKEEAKTAKEFDSRQLQRFAMISNFVATANPEVLVPGVLEAFSKHADFFKAYNGRYNEAKEKNVDGVLEQFVGNKCKTLILQYCSHNKMCFPSLFLTESDVSTESPNSTKPPGNSPL